MNSCGVPLDVVAVYTTLRPSGDGTTDHVPLKSMVVPVSWLSAKRTGSALCSPVDRRPPTAAHASAATATTPLAITIGSRSRRAIVGFAAPPPATVAAVAPTGA